MVPLRCSCRLLSLLPLFAVGACSVTRPEPSIIPEPAPHDPAGALVSTDAASAVQAAIESTRNHDSGSHHVSFEDWDGAGRRSTDVRSAWTERGWTIVFEMASHREPSVLPTEIRSVDGVRYGRRENGPWVSGDILSLPNPIGDPLNVLDALELAVRSEPVTIAAGGWYQTSWQMGLLNQLVATDTPTTARVRIAGGAVVEIQATLPDDLAVLHATWDPSPPPPIIAPI